MQVNEELRDQVFEIIKNQIRDNDPPETKKTFSRLIKMGISSSETEQLIGECVVVELLEVMKFQRPFDEKRYLKNLKNLPEEPFDE